MPAPVSVVADPVERVLERKQRYLVPCVYHFYRDPPLIVRGEGCRLFDEQGRSYLDCYSGVGTTSAGHSNPDILAAVREQLERLQHTTTIYLTGPMFELAERLAEIAPGNLCRSFFCASGTEANEAALLMAVQYTGRRGFLSFSGGLHGRTKAAMSVTRIPLWRIDPYLLEECREVPGYQEAHSLEHLAGELQTEKYAAVIAEPIQGNGGILCPPAGYWRELRALCDRTGTLLIADEVQTGIHRTGPWFAVEHEGVVPDLLTTAKALGNGFPIAACLTTDAIAAACTKPAASTYGGNPVSCAAALAVLSYHEQHHLGLRAAQAGHHLEQELKQLAAQTDRMAEVRGRGLMWGVELQAPTGETDADFTDRILETLKDRGYLLGKTGLKRNVLTIMPPLIISKAELTELCHCLGRVLEEESAP